MVATDRAFRALGRSEPETIIALVQTIAPSLLTGTPHVLSHDGLDTWLDRPLHPTEADIVLRLDPGDELLHVEGQGYSEDDFGDRALRYHLTLSLRHWKRQVHTLALWLVPPARVQQRSVLSHGSIQVKITTAVLREVDAGALLARPETLCFAVGADDAGRGHEALCMEAVRGMRDAGASLRRFQFAAAVARAHSKARFSAMLAAMNAQGVESVIIEDLVKIGEEMGMERGMEKGMEKGIDIGLRKGLRKTVLDLCEVLGVPLDEQRRAAVDAMEAPGLESLVNRLKTTRAW